MEKMYILLAGAFLIILLVFSYFLYRLWNRCSKLKNNLLDFQKSYKNSSNSNSRTKYFLDDNEIDTLVDIIVPLVLESVRLDLRGNTNQLSHTYNDRQTNDSVKFFRSKQGRVLQEETDRESAIFKVSNINGSEAKFEYCGDVINPDIITDVCAFENNPADVPYIRAIKTTTPGVVKKDRNNNWEVIISAKIKFI